MPENTPTSATAPPNAVTKRFDAALQTRQFEIDLFWKRSLFFWGFIGAAFVAIGALKGEQPALSLLISSFGLVCSLAWTLANRGSKYWQEQWESKIENVEHLVTGPLFKRREMRQEKGFWGGHRYSVSRLAILISDYVCLIWLLIFIRQCFISLGWSASQFDRVRSCTTVAVIIGTATSVIIVLTQGKSAKCSVNHNSEKVTGGERSAP